MKRPERYNTRQREAIRAFMASLGGGHVTAAQIVEHFGREGAEVGRTTVYRHLERLLESGEVRRYEVDGKSGACFQYVDNAEGCRTHWHLKCGDCGALLHLRCDSLRELQRHMMEEHAFEVDASRTVLYGRCDRCLRGG